jgi:hypothetical protein
MNIQDIVSIDDVAPYGDVASIVKQLTPGGSEGVSIQTSATGPTTTDIPDGKSGIYKDSVSGDISIWVNDGGDLKLFTLTLTQAALADAPATMTATAASDTEIGLSWDAVDSADNYVVQRSAASNYAGATEIYSGADLSFDDTGLTAATHYYYRVKAQKDGYTDSDWTNSDETTDA